MFLNRKYGALGLLLFAVYYSAVVSFSHVHMTDNGAIAHSHPYSSSHTHSAASLDISSSLSTILVVFVASIAALFRYDNLLANILSPDISFREIFLGHYLSQRGPPSMV